VRNLPAWLHFHPFATIMRLFRTSQINNKPFKSRVRKKFCEDVRQQIRP